MKKILLLLMLLNVGVLFSQTSPKFNFVIDNAITAFGINLPKGCLVYDLSNAKFYVLTAPALSTATLTTATKVQYPSMTGTPANDYLSVWTDANTIEGESELQYNGSKLTINGMIQSDYGTDVGTLYFGDVDTYIEGSSSGTGSYITLFTASSYGLTYNYNSGNPYFSPDLLAIDLGGSETPFDNLFTAKITDNGTCVGINNASPGTTYELNVTGDINLSSNLTFDAAGSTIDAWTESITADDDTDVPTEGAVYNRTAIADNYVVAGTGTGIEGDDGLQFDNTTNTLSIGHNLLGGKLNLSSGSTSGSVTLLAQSYNTAVSYTIPTSGLVDGYFLKLVDDATGVLEWAAPVSITSHGDLDDLDVDDHTQYALLDGRAGDVLQMDTIMAAAGGSEVVFKDDIWVYGTSATDNIHNVYFGENAHNYVRSGIDYLENGNHYIELHTEDIYATGFSLFTENSSGFNFRPSVNTGVNLGTNSYKWKTIYSTNLTDDYTNGIGIGGAASATYKLKVTGGIQATTNVDIGGNLTFDGAGSTVDAFTETVTADDDTDVPTEGAIYNRTAITDNYVVVGTGTGIEGTSNFTYTDNTQLKVSNASYDLYWNSSGLYGGSGGGSAPLGTSSNRWQKLWTGGADFSGSLQFNQAGSLIDAFTETVTADDDTDLPTEGAVYNYAITKSGTPVANQVAYFSDVRTIVGHSSFTYSSANYSLLLGIANMGKAAEIELYGASTNSLKLTPHSSTDDWTLMFPQTNGDENQFLQTNGGGVCTWATALTSEVDGSTTNEIEVVDETYNSTNFDGGTTSAVSQDDFYDYAHTGDTDDDALVDKVDLASAGFVKTNASGVLSVDATSYGNVSNTGTPVDNQLAVWTSSTVIEGDADLTFDGSNLTMTGLTVIDPSPNSDHTGSGTASIQTAAQTIGYGQLCYLNSSGKMALADADASSTMPGYFVCLVSAGLTTDQTGLFLESGYIRDDTWNWTTVGGYVYVSVTAGSFDESAPSGTGDQSQIVGIVVSADIIKFYPRAVVQIQ